MAGPVAGAVPEPAQANVGWHLVLGVGFAALFGSAGYLAQGRSERAIVTVRFTVSDNEAGVRLDKVLASRVEIGSRALSEKLLRGQAVRVVQHGLADTLLNDLLQLRAVIDGQDLQDRLRAQHHALVEQAAVRDGRSG